VSGGEKREGLGGGGGCGGLRTGICCRHIFQGGGGLHAKLRDLEYPSGTKKGSGYSDHRKLMLRGRGVAYWRGPEAGEAVSLSLRKVVFMGKGEGLVSL